MDSTPELLRRPLLGNDFALPVDRPFTTREAHAAGIDRHLLGRLHADGLLRRMLRGVHVAAQVPDTLELRCQALRLVAPTDAVAVDWTACWLWTGVLRFGQQTEVPAVSLFRPAGRGRLRNKLSDSGERSFAPGDVNGLHGLRVTTPLRTAWDLGRLSHRDAAIGALDALLRHGAFTAGDLVHGVERFRRQRGVVQLRQLAPLADPRAESPGESVLRLRWLDLASLPPPEPQISVVGPHGEELARIDLGVRELRLGVEYDGEEHHTSEEQKRHDRERRGWLRQGYGWSIRGVDRGNVFGPTRDIERILVTCVLEARASLARRCLTG
ncbi:MAG: type IV toxin-antitoxin system AbiEi family antitoxin domain-containing protein [Kineosporiaceae bacterium]